MILSTPAPRAPRRQRTLLHLWATLLAVGVVALGAPAPPSKFRAKPAESAKEKTPAKGTDSEPDLLAEVEGRKPAENPEDLRLSHFAPIEGWHHVEPLQPRSKVEGASYRWKMTRDGAAIPLGREPIFTLIDVPAEGEYRLYVRHWFAQSMPLPLMLTIQPMTTASADGGALPRQGTPLVHKFGEVRMIPKSLGSEQEEKLPLRFESEVQLATFPAPAMFVWEYRDVKLAKGAHRIELQSDHTDNRVSAVFLTRSKIFRPSLSEVIKDNTLGAVYCRFRFTGGAAAALATSLTYHWRGRTVPSTGEPLWGDQLPPIAKIAQNEWSPFQDARIQIVPGGGPYSTWRPSLKGAGNGKLEVQFAWQPSPGAVVRTIQTALSDGNAMFRVPHGRYGYLTPSDKPVWGVWDPERLKGLIPEEEVVERYFTWAEDAAKSLGLSPDHPKPKLVHVYTGCGTGTPHKARAVEMLARLGVNWIPDATPDLRRKFDLYDDTERKRVKMGDEISTHTSADAVNADPGLRAGFHDFLRKQATLEGVDMQAFLGTTDPASLEATDILPENPGRYERRLFYFSQRYAHLATIRSYAEGLKAIVTRQPGAIVYNNYSPHPTFLTGRDMNGADWFVLTRAGAQTLGWGEDWAYAGSWALGTPMAECVTFYAALVDCAARARRYPAGFYVGVNCGFAAQKMFSCLSQGISILELYTWGPIDAIAEGSNSWSEDASQYLSVMQGTHAIGPADEIIAKGTREKRRTAILYNRSHEILNGFRLWLNRDWMWTFLGLRNAQIPVEVIIEEDLNAETLAQYEVLFAGGMNLEKRHVQALRAWVEKGGLLIGSGGCAMEDVCGDRLPATVELFGAAQTVARPGRGGSHENIRFQGSDVFPDIELPAATAGNMRFVLAPDGANVAAKYDGGDVAATVHSLGKGRAVLLGVTPGEMFRASGAARGPGLAWLNAPVLKQLGKPRAQFDCPESEVTVFEHTSGTAVLVALYTTRPQELSRVPGRLSVKTERKVEEVRSALRGPLRWEMRDGRVEIQTPPPAEMTVDVILLR